VTYLHSCLACVCLVSVGPALAAEPISLRLREKPVIEGQVVHVGDLIEVIHGRCQQTDDLLLLPLAPAPREGTPQTWKRSDIIQHLELRGLHATSLRWLGAEQTQLRRGKPVQDQTTPGDSNDTAYARHAGQTIPSRGQTPAFVQERAVKQAEMLIRQAITEYVTLQSGDRTAWRISLTIAPQFVAMMQVKSNIVSIGGGQAPWEGVQNFTFEVKDRGALISVPIQATLQLPPMVVTAVRAMRREEIITAEALTYSPLPIRSDADPSEFFDDMDKLIGKQLRRSVSSGQPIESQIVGDAVVVTRSELVEVESVAGNIVVTTTGRASESGAVGDLIGIELLPSRKRIAATVTGPLKVRVAGISARSSN